MIREICSPFVVR